VADAHSELEADLAQLERAWAERRERLMIRRADGTLAAPGFAGGVLVALAGVAGGFLWLLMMSALPRMPHALALIGPLILTGGIGAAVGMTSQARVYRRARAEYERERAQLERQLAALPGGSGGGPGGELGRQPPT